MSDTKKQDNEFEQQIADYLRVNPDYFQRHANVLEQIEIPHETGTAVSLIEHQVKVLKQQSERHKVQLSELIEVARENERLNQRLHQLTLKLLEASSLNDVISTLQDELRTKFSADAVELKLFIREELDAHATDPGLAIFREFMDADKPTCGTLGAEKLKTLFGDQAGPEGSAALIPIRTSALSGVLAIGSRDTDRFHRGKGVDFLIRLGELVSLTLQAVGAAGELPLGKPVDHESA